MEAGLRELGIPFHQWGAVLKKLVARLPGWAGHIRWRNEYAGRDLVEDAPASAADLLALWTFVLRSAPDRWTWRADELHVDATEELLGHFDIGADQRSLHAEGRCALREIGSLHEDDLGLMFMEAAERTFRGSIVQRIRGSASTSPADGRPTAQLVFCIDVRSEPFRRAIESQGTYETLGYAGFFGLPISLTSADGASSRNLLPVLLRPAHAVVKGPAVGQETRARKSWAKKLRRSSAQRIFDAIKNGIGTSFAAAEATGPLAAARMVESCVGPSLKSLSGRDESCFAPDRSRIPLSDQVDYARSLFSMTGLGTNLARLVVLVGHGSHAVNNPFASALDCGACGGHRGGENARLLAAILNDADVRKALAEDSVEIPADTVFVGAEHDTTRDFVRVFDTQLIPATHEQDLANLKADLSTAGDRCREERGQRLGRSARDLLVGSQHWGEVRPEWGLAGNAAFIVGPRELTKDANLEGRVFLHSYNWASDPTGAALEVILTAPMIVAQWINCQYLFSTVDNSRFGAGDKITHNVLGGIGVVQGNGGDLRVGLPRQSLYDDQGVPYHVPQRLLTIVEAPLDRLEEIIDRNAILQRLFGNGWVQLIAVEPNTGRFRCWRTVKEFAKPGLKIEEQEGETLGARLVDA
ncbi:DUF2309 domain-containing protein [Sphingomonas sediminicola]|uniref:DUF2309 domain-containing protein n=1 Tax=Sphingomonas sediminicola TaxID=386874 RepID=A0ABX6TB47_9SPHN|nr:DUF2309 domain-containing protein [Sphingomonas sediminicola]